MNNQVVQGTPQQFIPMIMLAAKQYGVPASLLSAQIQHESGFNPTVTSKPNTDGSVDRGIAQINSRWHPEISNDQANSPSFAINWMANTMSNYFKKTGSWPAALSIYNSGSPTKSLGYADAILSNSGMAGVPTGQQGGSQSTLAMATPPQLPIPQQPQLNVNIPNLQTNLPQTGNLNTGQQYSGQSRLPVANFQQQLPAPAAAPSQIPQGMPSQVPQAFQNMATNGINTAGKIPSPQALHYSNILSMLQSKGRPNG